MIARFIVTLSEDQIDALRYVQSLLRAYHGTSYCDTTATLLDKIVADANYDIAKQRQRQIDDGGLP